MSALLRKSHNLSLLMYHFVFAAKYRGLVIEEGVDGHLKDVCIEISKRYEIQFLEIGTEGDHAHLLILCFYRRTCYRRCNSLIH